MAQRPLPRFLLCTSLAFSATLAPLTLPLAGSALLTPATAVTSPSPQGTLLPLNQRQPLHGVHTDALALDFDGRLLSFLTYAELPDTQKSALDPQTVFFHLPDTTSSRKVLPAGYEFIAEQGATIWLAPQQEVEGLLWPTWTTEDIAPGQLAGDSLTLELLDVRAPAGGSLEVFQDGTFGEPIRIWSSDEALEPYRQPVASQTSANWAFTTQGLYTLTFKASGHTTEGRALEAVQSYAFVVGEIAPDAAVPAPVLPTAPAPDQQQESPAEAPRPVTGLAAEEDSPAPSQDSTHSPADDRQTHPQMQLAQEADRQQQTQQAQSPHATGKSDTAQQRPAATQANPAQASAQKQVIPPAQPSQQQAPQQGETQPKHQAAQQGTTAPAPAQQKQQQTTGQNSASRPGTAQEQCIPTEVPVGSQDSTAHQADRASSNHKAQITTTLAHQPLTLHKAVNSNRQQVSDGHFDFGALLTGGQLTASVKDDRTSPATWVAPSSLEFVLSDAARKKMPAGMEHIAPAGSEVYLIGGTQEAGVPWLGWNTQDQALSQNVKGEVTLKLDAVQGPGKLSVFLTGNFGSAGQTVFAKPGDTFKVPLNTHQHGNWVFTAPGRYTATVSWHATLKDGKQVSTRADLHFVVGKVEAPPAEAKAEEPQQKQAPQVQEHGQSQPQGQAKQQGSVDSASGIVTRPDGSRVKIVGKNPSGADCTLSEQTLASAQKSAATGKLAQTGLSSGNLLGWGVLALAAGGGALLLARRRQRQNA